MSALLQGVFGEGRVRRARVFVAWMIGAVLLESFTVAFFGRWSPSLSSAPSTCEDSGGLVRFAAHAEPSRGVIFPPRARFAVGEPRFYVALTATGAPSLWALVPENMPRYATLRAGRSAHPLEVVGRVSPSLLEEARVAGVPRGACVIWLEDLPSSMAVLLAWALAAAAGVLVWRAWPASEALRGTAIVLQSKAEIYQVVQFGLASALLGAALAIDLLLRASGLRVVWAFPLGALFYLGLPVALMALGWIAPRAGRWIGLGVPR